MIGRLLMVLGSFIAFTIVPYYVGMRHILRFPKWMMQDMDKFDVWVWGITDILYWALTLVVIIIVGYFVKATVGYIRHGKWK